jgi:hypothetical protein
MSSRPSGNTDARKPFLSRYFREECADLGVVVDHQDVLQHGAAMFAEAGARNSGQL